MKKLFILVFTLFTLVQSSCYKPAEDFCWKCESVIYGKPYTDYPCYPDFAEIENYKSRLMDFYMGGMSSIECELLPQE